MPPDPRCTKCGSLIPRLVGAAVEALIDSEVPVLCSDCFPKGISKEGLAIYRHNLCCVASPLIDRMSRITNLPES